MSNLSQLHLVIASKGEPSYWQLKPDGSATKQPLPVDASAPLGSLWKLWVYAYLADGGYAADIGHTEAPYICQGNNTEEIYCCSNKGEQVERDAALAKSCGLYFNPARLNIDPAQWRNYWQARYIPDALRELDQVKPEQSIPLRQLLPALAQLPAQHQARQALLAVMLGPKGPLYAEQLGSRLRVKTWSWRTAQSVPIAGFAGWLADGTPLWAQAEGTSAQVLQRYAQALDALVPNPAPAAHIASCVLVNMFAAYPISQVKTAQQQPAESGLLSGQYEVIFQNGNRLMINSNETLRLDTSNGQPHITAQLTQEDYVARVLEREAAPEPMEAAKALSIVARTYLWQNAAATPNLTGSGECLSIDDSSKTQRVSPNPASRKALQIAYWTADLISQGMPVRYHLDQPGSNRLVWQIAVKQAQQGAKFTDILNHALPQNDLASAQQTIRFCQPLAQAQTWLQQQLPKWRAVLTAEPGFQPPPLPAICQLQSGNPYNEVARNRIFARGFYSLQQRLDIAHEYLHLAFADYPSGQDETYIEQLARRLLLGQETTHD
ncbi:MAG TPA: DUF2300 domain-containing protein [Cellvibrionaceae bacterium]